MSNLINNVRTSNKAFFKKEEKLSFKNQGLLTGAFSFGAVSLISACGADGGGTGGGEVPTPPDPETEFGGTYSSTVTLTTLEKPDLLDGGTESGITWSRNRIGTTDAHRVTMTVTLDSSSTITLDNVAYTLDTTSTLEKFALYDEIDGSGGKDIIFYSPNFYKDKPFSSTPLTNSSYYGGVTILWDMPDTSAVGFNAATFDEKNSLKYLHIAGHESNSLIRNWSPQMLKINTGDDYDLMVTASGATFADGSTDDRTTAGAIYIFWDISQYKNQGTGKVSFDTSHETKNFLSIYGASSGDQIAGPVGAGASSVLFSLSAIDKYDLVFSSASVDDKEEDVGGIYVLWDVASYSSGRKIIDLADTISTSGNYASQGLLAIYGNSADDQLQLTQLTKDITHFNFSHVDDDKDFDFVVYNKDERISDGAGGNKVAGAIYILWNIGSYAIPKHQKIILDPDDSASATYGLFSIIGESIDIGLDDKFSSNPLLTTTMDDSSIAKDLNGDKKKDIAFTYDSNTYVIFGEAMTEKNDLKNTIKSKTINIIKSKTIDLADVSGVDRYFDYTFDGVEVANVGYVFDTTFSSLDAIDTTPLTNLSETFESHDYWIV